MIAFFTRHPTASNLLMLVLVVLGVMQLPNLKRETFPDITPKQVLVTVVYRGASAEEIEHSSISMATGRGYFAAAGLMLKMILLQ